MIDWGDPTSKDCFLRIDDMEQWIFDSPDVPGATF
jgi:hypothetical protein